MEEIGLPEMDEMEVEASLAEVKEREGKGGAQQRGGRAEESEGDFYLRLKRLEGALATLQIEEEYIKDEYANLKRELSRAQEEVKRIKCLCLPFFSFCGSLAHSLLSILGGAFASYTYSGAVGDRAVPRDDRHKPRDCGVDNGEQYVCENPEHNRPRAAQAIGQRRVA